MTATEPQHSQSKPNSSSGDGLFEIRTVPFDQPWIWLSAGWRDLWNKPAVSLAYGVSTWLATLLLVAGLWMLGLEALVPALAGGLLLVGPLLAVGLYEKSRLLAAGESVTLVATIRAALGSAGRIGPFAAVLLIVYLAWLRIAFLLFMLFFGTRALPSVHAFVPELLFTAHGLALLVIGTAVGAALAVVVFVLSAISVPLLMERQADVITAMMTSARAVAANPKPMALWAVLIAGFVALGIATLGAGLVLAFPLIGHATWHAYRDVVDVASGSGVSAR